jgi:hypothetical protein
MLKLQLPAEQSLSLWMFAADALDRAEGHGGQPPSQEAKAILRIATPVLKFRATRDGRRVTGDAMEMRGGIGYVEEWANPRLVRDAHLGSIWEGAGNVVAIDVVQRAIRRHACHEPFIAAVRAKLDDASDVPDAHRNALREALDNAGRLAGRIASSPENEIESRHVTTMLYHAATAALLKPRDPFAASDPAREEAIAACLLGDKPASMAEVAEML